VSDPFNHHPSVDQRTYDELIDLYVARVENTPHYPKKHREYFHSALQLEAKKFIDALIARNETREWVDVDKWHHAVETHIIISLHVHDPNDWDHVSTAIELTEYIVESR
jgi:hypothetical protein